MFSLCHFVHVVLRTVLDLALSGQSLRSPRPSLFNFLPFDVSSKYGLGWNCCLFGRRATLEPMFFGFLHRDMCRHLRRALPFFLVFGLFRLLLLVATADSTVGSLS